MASSVTLVAASTSSVVLRYAAAFFFVAVAVGMLWALLRTAKVLKRVGTLLTDFDKEVMPLINKAGTTVDEVNNELARVNEITQVVVDMTQKAENVVGSVESVIAKPARMVAGLVAGLSQAIASFLHFDGDDGIPESDEAAGGDSTGNAAGNAAGHAAGGPGPAGDDAGGEAAAPADDGFAGTEV